jgi:hypothetical protein
MDILTSLLRRLTIAGLLGVCASAQADVVVFSSESSFLAAVTAPAVDTFAGFPTTVLTDSPITRTAGPYSYTASSTSGFFGAGTLADPALSTNSDSDVITFANLSGGANAIGGLFFGTDVLGSFVSATIVLTAVDSIGNMTTETFVASPSSFIGFLSTGSIVSLLVTTATPGSFVFPTVDNLTLAIAAVAPIPEPETWALLVAGLGAMGYCARRRRPAPG